jgi:glycosyltransferase involved in cell wall biosynthesis
MTRGLPVSVIVLCWNSRQRIGDCLASLLALESPAAELIVVDNASSDESCHCMPVVSA